MEIVVGCDLEEFRRYYEQAGLSWGSLGPVEESHVKSDPSHLIVLREGGQILGHAIWHESNTEEHKKGHPRDEDDRRMLRTLVGPGKAFVELHEVWLKTEHRGKGYGKRLFNFFEGFISRRGHDLIVYYADHPAALAICRERGYQEAVGVGASGRPVYVFSRSLDEKAEAGGVKNFPGASLANGIDRIERVKFFRKEWVTRGVLPWFRK